MNPAQLQIKPQRMAPGSQGIRVKTTPTSAGWEYLSFQVRHLPAAAQWAGETGNQEAGLVLITGRCTMQAGEAIWELGPRASPFVDLPWGAYLPPHTPFTIQALEPSELGWAEAPAEGRFPARLVRPADVRVDERGAGTTARSVANILGPDFPAERLIVVEAITPEGHWSSYPPHKHDLENPPHENKLEETYYYRIAPSQGFALQRIYTADGRWDVALVCQDGDLVLVPEGYHPVGAAAGYTCYYLNAQAGPTHAWLIQDDPAHAWIKDPALRAQFSTRGRSSS